MSLPCGMSPDREALDRIAELNAVLPSAVRDDRDVSGWKKKPVAWKRHRRVRIGDEVHTLVRWAELRGLKYRTVMGRLQSGHDIVDALQPGKLEPKRKTITLHGEEMSIQEAARRSGIPYATLVARLRAGHAPEIAVKMKAQTKAQAVRDQLEAEIRRLKNRIAELEKRW